MSLNLEQKNFFEPGRLYSILQTENFVVNIGYKGLTQENLFRVSNPLYIHDTTDEGVTVKSYFLVVDERIFELLGRNQLVLLHVKSEVLKVNQRGYEFSQKKILHKFLIGKHEVYFHDTLIDQLGLVKYG